MSDQSSVSSGGVEQITPEKLISRFCGNNAIGLIEKPGTTVKDDGTRVSRGWCGLTGGRGDSMVVGFEDGCDFWDYLSCRGWVAVRDKGTWPYVVYLVWKGDEELAIIEYCEGDLALWEFASEAKAREFGDTLS